ncbi:MAG: transcriptional repressor [Thermodesulfovibrionales bacterium]|nr:transcriptional repressor [Thermodesulfovibrionales bacterium]
MEKYKDIGLKLTPQRLAILGYLEDNKEHPSAEDIYRAVSKKFPTMSFATVYNTLETLRKKRSILQLTIDPAKKRFDPNTEPHHHLICVKCKMIADIHRDYKLPIPNKERAGFEIIGNQIEFYGICPRCKTTKSKGVLEEPLAL